MIGYSAGSSGGGLVEIPTCRPSMPTGQVVILDPGGAKATIVGVNTNTGPVVRRQDQRCGGIVTGCAAHSASTACRQNVRVDNSRFPDLQQDAVSP
jgi:hypothetical protein